MKTSTPTAIKQFRTYFYILSATIIRSSRNLSCIQDILMQNSTRTAFTKSTTQIRTCFYILLATIIQSSTNFFSYMYIIQIPNRYQFSVPKAFKNPLPIHLVSTSLDTIFGHELLTSHTTYHNIATSLPIAQKYLHTIYLIPYPLVHNIYKCIIKKITQTIVTHYTQVKIS